MAWPDLSCHGWPSSDTREDAQRRSVGFRGAPPWNTPYHIMNLVGTGGAGRGSCFGDEGLHRFGVAVFEEAEDFAVGADEEELARVDEVGHRAALGERDGLF